MPVTKLAQLLRYWSDKTSYRTGIEKYKTQFLSSDAVN